MPRSSSPEKQHRRVADEGGGGGPPLADEGGGGGGGGDRLIKVAYAPNQPVAEMIQALLREHGIPSMLKRAPGFDVPEFLAGGPHNVFVHESVAERARDALEGTPGGE